MSWVIAAHRSELEQPGDYVVLPWRADGEVAVANMDGHLVAFDNRCPHRGARIYTGLRGHREPRCIYHGRLATPGAVARFALGWIGDFVLVSADANAVLAAPAGIVDFLADTGRLWLHSSLELVMDCPWVVAVENALDVEHVEFAHAATLGKLNIVSAKLSTFGDGSSIDHFIAGTAKEVRSMRVGKVFPRTKPFPYSYIHAHVYPASCLSSLYGWSYSLQHYFPRADGRTSFIHRLYAAETNRPLPEFFDAVARQNEQVFREDAAVCALVPDAAPGVERLGRHETRIARWREARARLAT